MLLVLIHQYNGQRERQVYVDCPEAPDVHVLQAALDKEVKEALPCVRPLLHSTCLH